MKDKEREAARSSKLLFMSRLTRGMKTWPNTTPREQVVADEQVFDEGKGVPSRLTPKKPALGAEQWESVDISMPVSNIYLLLDCGLSRRIEAPPPIGRQHECASRFVAFS